MKSHDDELLYSIDQLALQNARRESYIERTTRTERRLAKKNLRKEMKKHMRGLK